MHAAFAALLLLCSAPKPNVVVLLCDDLGYGDLGCFGHKEIKTPHLDALAKGGLRLTACYASAPVCSPSRAGLLTGQHPYRNGIRDWIPLNKGTQLPKDAPSVAKSLKAAGYRTAHVGKWHLNSRMDSKELTPGDHGYEHWVATQNNAIPSHENPNNFVKNGKKMGPLKGNSSRLIADEALGWLKGVKKDEPFLLSAWFHAPHEPVAVSEEWAKRYAGEPNADRRQYLASVALMDHAVGRILEALRGRGCLENTFIVFTSDNGPETLRRYRGAHRSYGSPGPLRGMKLHLTEGGIRVPGILSWKGRIKPGVSAVPVCNVDVLPTACELAGAPLPKAPLDGTSLVPLIDGKPLKRAVPLYWQYDRALGGYHFALRDGAWKLLAGPKMGKLALYNLVDDVGEKKDLAAEHPGRVKAMLAALKKRHREIDPLAK